mmetsp:Transcript_16712/g.25760  ORF Transcript_16712/g.25760 Transcript_16712/m.25760 type:complete len:210 (-) Transcript_16712:2073-2702(-)
MAVIYHVFRGLACVIGLAFNFSVFCLLMNIVAMGILGLSAKCLHSSITSHAVIRIDLKYLPSTMAQRFPKSLRTIKEGSLKVDSVEVSLLSMQMLTSFSMLASPTWSGQLNSTEVVWLVCDLLVFIYNLGVLKHYFSQHRVILYSLAIPVVSFLLLWRICGCFYFFFSPFKCTFFFILLILINAVYVLINSSLISLSQTKAKLGQSLAS